MRNWIRHRFLHWANENFSVGPLRDVAHVGSGVVVDPTTTITSGQMVRIGSDTYIGPHGYLAGDGGLVIGRGVMIGPMAYLQTSTHNFDSADLAAVPYDHRIVRGPIAIEDYAWLGGRVTILPGVRIGKGAIIGAGSVVTRDVEPLAVVVGNPARVVSRRSAQRFNTLSGEGMSHRRWVQESGHQDTWLDGPVRRNE